MKQHILMMAGSLLLWGPSCSAPGPTNPVEPRPTPIVTDSDYCDKAEANLVRLNCPEGNPTKKGKSFSDLCFELQQKGVFLNPKCLSTVTSCDQVDYCTHSK